MMNFNQYGNWCITEIDTEDFNNPFGARGMPIYNITLRGDGTCMICGKENEFICEDCKKIIRKHSKIQQKLKKL